MAMPAPPPPSAPPSDDAAPPSSPRQLSAFLAANAAHAASGTPRYSSVTAAPARRAAVLACMDARLHLEALLGLQAGDCHVIRNGGGRVTADVMLSLVASQQARTPGAAGQRSRRAPKE
jgi:carbonic anhydrase